MKLRLLVTRKCNRNCKWCNNQHWNLAGLPQETVFSGYNEIMLTGGEPMLIPEVVISIAKKIRIESNAKIYLYTAKIDKWESILAVLHYIDGMSITPHTIKDVTDFKVLNSILIGSSIEKSLKLNLFSDYGFDLSGIDLSMWRIKHKSWIKTKHLPENEVFKRI